MSLENNQVDKNIDSFQEVVINIGRVTKVTSGGKNFKLKAVSVVGNGKGLIGIGKGKGKEVPSAIQKSFEFARRNLFKVNLNGDTVYHEIEAKYGATKVIIKPARPGTGIIAGGAMRGVFEVLGVKNVIAKCIGSRNKTNVLKALLKGLLNMSTPESVSNKLNVNVEEIFKRIEEN